MRAATGREIKGGEFWIPLKVSQASVESTKSMKNQENNSESFLDSTQKTSDSDQNSQIAFQKTGITV